MLHVQSATDIGPPLPGVYVYDDGSIVDAQRSPMTVRPLSATGLEWLLQEVRGTGLFTSSRSIPFEPVDHGFTSYRVTFNDGDTSTWVQATNVATDAESRALIELAEHVFEPAAWLPADGWVDGNPRPRPYLARQTRVTTELADLASDAWVNGAQTLDRLAWPLDVSPLRLGDEIDVPNEPNRALRCAFISGGGEAAVRRALEAFEGGGEDRPFLAAWYLWTTGPRLLKLTLRPLLPHEPSDCGVAELPSRPRLADAPRPSLATLLVVSQNGWSPPATAEPTFFVAANVVAGEADSRRVSYYPDGTLLFSSPPPPIVGFGVLRLTADGQQLIDEALATSGLLHASYSERIPDDVEIDTMYNIVTEEVVLNGSDRGVDARADAIVDLARRLLDPAAWLPAPAWIDGSSQLLQYRPPAIKVSIRRETGFDEDLPSAERLQWPWQGTPLTFGQPDPELPGIEARVSTIGSADALRIVRAAAAAGARSEGGPSLVEYWFGLPEPGSRLVIELSIPAGEWGM